MKVVVISHKECWDDPERPGGVLTVGGFPYQIAALCERFEAVQLIATRRRSTPAPAGASSLRAPNLQVTLLEEPRGTGWRRKVYLAPWLLRHARALLRGVREADLVHALVPGDVGGLGLLLAWATRTPLLVRHCGAWGTPETAAERLLHVFLERAAGDGMVVLATGEAAERPSARNAGVRWIFSTTLREAELEGRAAPPAWTPGEPLRLVTVARLSPDKNVLASVQALGHVREVRPGATLDVAGDGPERDRLEREASRLGLGGAVRFHGNRSHREVLELLGRSHLFVFPTRTREGFPKALGEALACGVPAVATRVSVVPRLLDRGCGRVLEDPTAQALADAVLELTEDSAELARMGERARTVGADYTLERWVEALGRAAEDAREDAERAQRGRAFRLLHRMGRATRALVAEVDSRGAR